MTDTTIESAVAPAEKPKFKRRPQIAHTLWREALTHAHPLDNVIDPTGCGAGDVAEPIDVDKVHVYGISTPAARDAFYVFDIESWGLRPDKLHVSVLMSFADKSYVTARSWDEVFQQIIEIAERHAKDEKGERGRVKIFAHNGAKFDWLGLADHLQIGYGNPRLIEFPGVLVRISIEVFGNRHSIKIDYDRAAESETVKSGGRGRPKKQKISSAARCTLELHDSLWHINAGLGKLGAKGVTPQQYTAPAAWLIAQNRKPDDFDFWHSYLDPQALDYCINDCAILVDTLRTYHNTVYSLFGISPLDFMTASKVSLACSIAMAWAKELPKNFHLFKDKGSDWHLKIGEKAPTPNDPETPVLPLDYPLAPGNVFATSSRGWWCQGHVVNRFKRVQFGGRCEVFAIRNAPETRVVVFDAASHYPSVIAGANGQRYVDPRFFTSVADRETGKTVDLVGKTAIQEHLKNHSGMYLIECDTPLNALVRQYPVFPMRVTGANPDDRLIFPDWSGVLRLYVTGEELNYFLSITDIKNDNIKVIGKKSLTADLLDSQPQGQVVRMLYGKRRDAKNDGAEGLSLILKLLLNAGTFGVLLQTKDRLFEVPESDNFAAMAALHECEKFDPDWSDWSEWRRTQPAVDNETGEIVTGHDGAIKTVEYLECDEPIRALIRFANGHYFAVSSYHDKNDSKIYVFKLPAKRSPHAIVPWGVQITAHARVELHKKMMAMIRAGGQLLYTDTDSVHAAFPLSMSKNDIVKALETQGVPVGNDLGMWDYEAKTADRKLLSVVDFKTEIDVTNIWKIDGINGRDAKTPAKKAGFKIADFGEDFLSLATSDTETRDSLFEKLSQAGIPVTAESVNDTGDRNFVIRNPQGWYLGPKNYHYTDSHGNILYSVLKGVARTAPEMRPAQLGWTIGMSRLGEKRGIDLEIPSLRDTWRGVGERPRRHYRDLYSSTSITLDDAGKMEAPIFDFWSDEEMNELNGDAPESWLQYMRRIGNVRGDDTGFREAKRLYRHLKISGETVSVWRNRIRSAYEKIAVGKINGEIPDIETLKNEMRRIGLIFDEATVENPDE
jgi:hypothetical protein